MICVSNNDRLTNDFEPPNGNNASSVIRVCDRLTKCNLGSSTSECKPVCIGDPMKSRYESCLQRKRTGPFWWNSGSGVDGRWSSF